MKNLYLILLKNIPMSLLIAGALVCIAAPSFGRIPMNVYNDIAQNVSTSGHTAKNDKLNITMNLCTGMATYAFLRLPYDKNYIDQEDPFELFEDPLKHSKHTNDIRNDCAQFIREYITLNKSNEDKLSAMSDQILNKTAALLDDLSQSKPKNI